MDPEVEQSFLTTAKGNIKVEVNDLVRLFYKLSSNDMEDDFVKYFKKKYLTLTALREQEHQAYEYYKQAKGLVKKPEDYELVAGFEKEYQNCRIQRMQLQAELEKDLQKTDFCYLPGRSR